MITNGLELRRSVVSACGNPIKEVLTSLQQKLHVLFSVFTRTQFSRIDLERKVLIQDMGNGGNQSSFKVFLPNLLGVSSHHLGGHTVTSEQSTSRASFVDLLGNQLLDQLQGLIVELEDSHQRTSNLVKLSHFDNFAKSSNNLSVLLQQQLLKRTLRLLDNIVIIFFHLHLISVLFSIRDNLNPPFIVLLNLWLSCHKRENNANTQQDQRSKTNTSQVSNDGSPSLAVAVRVNTTKHTHFDIEVSLG
mmetsp:Transcript_10710/g.16134  ORF Transcript_10710/g.16134 Transcript_10710/m.16134 type:complete len:247 (+) Transcript_10710:1338-2078(+)